MDRLRNTEKLLWVLHNPKQKLPWPPELSRYLVSCDSTLSMLDGSKPPYKNLHVCYPTPTPTPSLLTDSKLLHVCYPTPSCSMSATRLQAAPCLLPDSKLLQVCYPIPSCSMSATRLQPSATSPARHEFLHNSRD
jgi:hypothetical protein